MPADRPAITGMGLRRETENPARDTSVRRGDTHPLVSPAALGTALSCLTSWDVQEERCPGGRYRPWMLIFSRNRKYG